MKRECRTFDEWQTYVKICDRKNKIITQHKKNDFRATMQTSENYFKKFFKMTKWVRNAKKKIMSQTIISLLKKHEKLITTTQNKIEIMFKTHFSFLSTMFMKDAAKFNYFSSIDDETPMTRREIMKIIYKINSNKTFKINKIINKMLRQFVHVIVKQIHFFFDKYIKKEIQSSHFKKIFTIMLRKSKKKNYSKLSSYKSIALLNILNKMLKLIVFKRIQYAVETLKTFLNIQMSARKQRSMNTTLQLIIKKIHTIWNEQKKKMTSFFNLNVNDVFDNVSHFRFLYNIKKKKISDKLLKWMKNFLKNKNTTLIIKNHTMTKRRINVNILQNSSFFSMLYLFYNANLLKSCENVKLCFSVIEFVNDINILTYNESTERNCKMLKKTWKKVVEWAKKHNFKFNERKHELIHFSKIFKKYNMNVNMTLKKHRINANIDFKILRIQLNFKLRWKSHFRQMKTKLMNKHNAINMIKNLI